MIRALPLVSVRKKEGNGGALPPLLLTRRDELVDDRLGSVGEVAELGLPHDEGIRPGDRVAVLEAHRGELAEERVVDVELGVAAIALLERLVLPPGLLVDDDHVTVAEGSAPGILAGEAHDLALEEE
ncbi:unannotated protein [freshwater metagenome]|uniref:Unannotated protein n=1 Tax=freshwater metagenome TaxID=449393 RepID=A0A6J7MV30_9ZZZZ